MDATFRRKVPGGWQPEEQDVGREDESARVDDDDPGSGERGG